MDTSLVSFQANFFTSNYSILCIHWQFSLSEFQQGYGQQIK